MLLEDLLVLIEVLFEQELFKNSQLIVVNHQLQIVHRF